MRTASQIELADLKRKALLGKVGAVDPWEKWRQVPLLCNRCKSRGRADDGKDCDCPGGAHLTDYRRTMDKIFAIKNIPRRFGERLEVGR